jgi:hypothetical protein
MILESDANFFKELEGPVPLFVIPEGKHGDFRLNEFVLRIMAVDFQNKNADISMKLPMLHSLIFYIKLQA